VIPTRPILRWHGGKWRIAPWVISHFPPHRIYVEPFGGAASVLLQKPRVVTEIYNDLDRDVVSLFQVIRERPRELAAALLLYERTDDALEAARRFVARSYFGMHSKGAITKSGFDTRVNPDAFVGRLRAFVDVPDEIAAVCARFMHIVIENVPALKLIARFDRDDTLIYADPPYVAETRSGKGKVYNHEMTLAQHCELLDALIASKSMVAISGYETELYLDRLRDWSRLELKASTDGGYERTEMLWLNPACGVALARASHAHRSGAGMPLFSEAAE
jgi:DNA adenine methylase